MNNIQKLSGGVALALTAVIGSIISIEGGYSNHPDDTGGATMYGITESVARANGYEGPMQELPLEVAENTYMSSYIVAPRYDEIFELSKGVGSKLIDSGVNVGTHRATKWFQESLNALNRGGRDYPEVAADGIIGPATIAAYRSLVEVREASKACKLVLKLLDVHQGYHYINLKQHNSFTVGWIDKRVQNVPLSTCDE